MRRALLALDLHDDATPTLAAAAPIAERLGLTLDLVWVDRHEAAAAMSRYTTLTLQLAEARAALHAQDALRLRAMLAGLPAACRGEALALDGEPAEAIAAIADRYDLVILGSHGRAGLARLVMGSVAEQILRAITRPALILHPDAAAPPPILIAVDLTPRADAVIAAALPWLTALGGPVDLVHVDDVAIQATAPIEALPHHDETPEARARTAGLRAALDRLAAPIPGHRSTVLLRGSAAPAIAGLAEGYGLVVLGTHGAAGRSWFGSVAEHTLRRLTASALVVHAG